jgi:hypothetical protein
MERRMQHARWPHEYERKAMSWRMTIALGLAFGAFIFYALTRS